MASIYRGYYIDKDLSSGLWNVRETKNGPTIFSSDTELGTYSLIDAHKRKEAEKVGKK